VATEIKVNDPVIAGTTRGKVRWTLVVSLDFYNRSDLPLIRTLVQKLDWLSEVPVGCCHGDGTKRKRESKRNGASIYYSLGNVQQQLKLLTLAIGSPTKVAFREVRQRHWKNYSDRRSCHIAFAYVAENTKVCLQGFGCTPLANFGR